jgi:tRNA(Ile)-lysidine synthase
MAFDPDQHFRQFDFHSCKHVLVAVSGGSDSLGLLHGLHVFLQSMPSRPLLSAVTVDHALRATSAAEAAGVAAFCAKLGISHIIKTWQGAKPLTGIQSAARDERRALISQCASEIGADVILTGHTLDDQIETVVMRQRRGSGPGLAGIAAASLAFDDRGDGRPIWIVRPLLDVKRADIRDYLNARSVAWADDPSNENLAYERIAVRRELAGASEEHLRDLRQLSATAAARRARLAADAGEIISNFVQEVMPGLVVLDPTAFAGNDPQALTVLLRTLIAFAGASSSVGDGLIAQTIIERVLTLDSSKGTKPWRETSNGALIEVRRTGVFLLREGRRKRHGQLEFDGRYRTTGAALPARASLALPLNVPVPASLVRRAADMEPMYSDNETVTHTAYEAARSGYPLRRLINPWPDLVPLFDFPLAKSLYSMAGEADIFEPPVYSHGKN